ncbi:MAG: transketolase [Armatimonas sp.]
MSSEQTALWTDLARQLRADSIRCTTAAGSGHPTSGMSAADLMAVLQASYLKYDFATPHNPNNDHLIFSKGHACPVLYAMYRAADAISDADLLSVRKFGSIYEGHPTPLIPHVDAATGSLGQGIAIAVGVAIAGKHIEKRNFKVWCLLGDSEMAEGSVYEALMVASEQGLDNLIAIVDVNKLGQRGETALGHDMAVYAARITAFGWKVFIVDGHNVHEINEAYAEAVKHTGSPVCILAKTEKGGGVSWLAGAPGWHGKALKPDEEAKALAELSEAGPISGLTVKPQLPEAGNVEAPTLSDYVAPVYEKGSKVAVRKAYGDGLAALGKARSDVFAVDAEVGNSTYTEIFGKAFPDRHFQMYIAEQIMVSVAQGLDVRGHRAFAATFAAFFCRAYDQIRMAAVSRASLRLVGTHAGVSIGEDGPSQMALEDLAMMRSVHSSAVLYPSDAVCAAALIPQMAERKGITYMRATREATPVLYGGDESFTIGGSKTLRDGTTATVIAAGITLHEALEAADKLAGEGISIRVIDLYSVKPIDAATVIKAAQETGHLIVAEDHWAEGGLADAVLAALAEAGVAPKKFTHLCIKEMPVSGKPAELLAAYGIDAEAIASAVRG